MKDSLDYFFDSLQGSDVSIIMSPSEFRKVCEVWNRHALFQKLDFDEYLQQPGFLGLSSSLLRDISGYTWLFLYF